MNLITPPSEDTRLSDALARCREEVIGWEPVYNDFIEHLRGLDIGARAPRVGEPMPPFALPNSRGVRVQSSDLVRGGPLVLSFNRGGWCPFCRTELAVWSEMLPALQATGGRFVAVTGEVGGRAEALRREVHLDTEVLCDVDHGLALKLGLAFYMGADLRRRYLNCGLDLAEVYGTPSWFLPVPATFVIDAGGIVRFAFVEPDFRRRAEPADVIAAVAGITAAQRAVH